MFHFTADGSRGVGSALRLPDLAQSRKEARRIDGPGSLVLSKGREMPAPSGHRVVGTGGHRAPEDSVVGVTSRSHSRESRRDNHGGGVLNGPSYLCGAFPIPANLPVSTSATSSRMKSERKNENLPRRASSSVNRSLPGKLWAEMITLASRTTLMPASSACG